jgi:hypothetical protein
MNLHSKIKYFINNTHPIQYPLVNVDRLDPLDLGANRSYHWHAFDSLICLSIRPSLCSDTLPLTRSENPPGGDHQSNNKKNFIIL